jgi:succinate dehydrogenase / fumarate reductase cytochrome b subunit
MVILSFQDRVISGVYLLALFILSRHLSHGASSFLQTLGLTHEPMLKKIKIMGTTLAWLIFIGYASIPVSAALGILKPLQGGR